MKKVEGSTGIGYLCFAETCSHQGTIHTDDPNGPYGAKEASEGAIVSAIHDATGVWIKEQPLTPEKIVMAIRDLKGE